MRPNRLPDLLRPTTPARRDQSARRRRAATATLAAAFLLAGCGSDGGDAAGAPVATGAAESTAPTDPTSEPAADPTSEPSADPTSEPAADPASVPDELDFSAATVGGGSFDARTLAGQDAVFFFWAPSCPICRAEAPKLAAVAAEYDDLNLVGVAHTGSLADMETFVRTTGLGDVTNIADESGEIWTRFGVTYQYTYAFVDDTGSIEVVSGPFGESELRERFDALTA